MFKVSDKVVCVDAKWNPRVRFAKMSSMPVVGTVYVVRGSYLSPGDGEPSCRLVGINGNICKRFGTEYGFKQHHFRKLEEIKEENRLKNYEPERTPEKVS